MSYLNQVCDQPSLSMTTYPSDNFLNRLQDVEDQLKLPPENTHSTRQQVSNGSHVYGSSRTDGDYWELGRATTMTRIMRIMRTKAITAAKIT